MLGPLASPGAEGPEGGGLAGSSLTAGSAILQVVVFLLDLALENMSENGYGREAFLGKRTEAVVQRRR